MQELVSIILPTYNRESLIGETVSSVIEQTYKNWELIIVDDGSTDDTRKRISDLNDARITYHYINHCAVIGRVRNEGLLHARGSYIAFLDSDDIWLPDKLDYQLSLLKAYPQASFVFGHGEQFGYGSTPTPELEEFFAGNVFRPFLFEERFIFYVPTLLFKHEILKKVALIDERLERAGDIDFFLQLAYSFEGVFSNSVVVRIRKHEQSHSTDNELVAFDEYLMMLEKHWRENRLTSKQFGQVASRYRYKMGLFYLDAGRARRAAREFLKCIYLKPFGWKGWIRLAQSFFKSE